MNNASTKRLISACILALLMSLPLFCESAPNVSNVRASQRIQGQLVDIFYALSATNSGPFSVSVAVSTNNGITYDLSASSFSGGGFGNTVTLGTRKQIVWDAGSDWPGKYSSAVRFKITASEIMDPTGMVLIPAGKFVMGATTNVGHEAYSGEIPQRTVYVSAFYIDRAEVTKALWDDVAHWAAGNGYDITVGGGLGKATNYPVHTVTWYECVKWCNARSEKNGLTPCYTLGGVTIRTGNNVNVFCNWAANGYRLPTEAEWEKAARGGRDDHRFPWNDSDEIQHKRANYYSMSNYAYDTSPTRGYHPTYSNAPTPCMSPVGAFAPNEYGLFDIVGNASEWCWDWYSSSYYTVSPGTDPRGPAGGVSRMLRGGNWSFDALSARVGSRNVAFGPTYEGDLVGFRCAKSAIQFNRTLWINEIHYENAGVDTNEGVEIAGLAGTDLSLFSVLWYDGQTGSVYSNHTLFGTIDNEAGGYGAIWFALPYSASGAAQDGSPDGLALVCNSTGLVQFLSYEGSFVASGGAADGVASIDICVIENSSTPHNNSLQFVGPGRDFGAFVWAFGRPHSRGSLNVGQIIPDAE